MTPDDLNEAVTRSIQSAPELSSSPALAVAAGQAGGPDVAQPIAQAQNSYAQDQAIQNTGKVTGSPDLLHKSLGWLGGALQHVGHDVNAATGGTLGSAVNALGGPLREVQHQYRYLHDVEARHGPTAALLEGLGIAAGAALGSFAAPGPGTVLGGELASEAESHLFYKDSYARTEYGAKYQPDYNRQTGEVSGAPGTVSIGRDISNAIGLKPGSKPYTYFSGAADALADLGLDPVQQAGGFTHALTGSEEGLAGAIKGVDEAGNVTRSGGSKIPALAAFSPGTQFVTPEDVDKAVAAYPSVRRGMQGLADMTTEQLTASKKWGTMAAQLGPATNVEQVAQVFKDNIDVARTVSSTLPTSTLVGGLIRRALPDLTSGAVDAAGNPIAERAGLPARIVGTFTHNIPTAFDPTTLALSGREFAPESDFAIHGVYQTALMSGSEKYAQMVAGQFANADPGQRVVIYRNIVTRMLAMRGLDDANEVDAAGQLTEKARLTRQSLDQMLGGSAPGHDAHYATDDFGRDISQVVGDDGRTYAAGVGFNQQGKLAFPDYSQIVSATRKVTAYKSVYGAVDDFIWKDFTQAVFKKLALLSGGFAQRIAMAEAIPAAMREHVSSLVRTQLAATAGKLGWEAISDPDEVQRVAGIAYKLTHGIATTRGAIENVSGKAGEFLNNPETLQDMTDMVASLNGQRIPSAVDAGSHYSAEVGGAAVKAERDVKVAAWTLPRGQMSGDKFGVFGNDNLNFDQLWAQKLSAISNEPLHQFAADRYMAALNDGLGVADASERTATELADHIRQMDPAVVSNMARRTATSTVGVDPIEDWAKVVVADLRGATHSPGRLDEAGNIAGYGTPNQDLLRNVSEGTQTPMSTLTGIAPDMKPLKVEGREIVDIPHQNVLQRISNFGFSRVLDPIINKLSREPIYANEWLKQYQPLKQLIADGTLDKGDAIQLAHTRAVQNVVPFIHNTLERSQFAELSHNYMPFFFAQQQALARYGRVLMDDPAAFRKLQLMTTGLKDVASSQKDPNGANWMVYPGLGFMTSGTVSALQAAGFDKLAGAVPIAFSGRVASLNTVMPLSDVAPKFGPVVAIGGHVIENLFPEARPAVTKVIGGAANSGGVWDQLLPNTFLSTMVKAFGDPNKRSFASAMMTTMQSLAYQQGQAMDAWVKAGHDPTDPGAPNLVPDASAGPIAQQQYIDRVKNQTRLLYVMKAFIGAVTPTAVTPNIGDMKLTKELQDNINTLGISAGIQKYLTDNPDATPFTVAQSDSQTPGASLPATSVAEDFLNAHKDLIAKYPYAAAWMVPQDATGTYDQAIYNEQLAQNFRIKKTPTQFMNDLYIAAGNQQYYDVDKPKFDAAIKSAAGDAQAQSAIRSNFSAYLNTYGKQNPIWWTDFQSPERSHVRELAAQQLQQMVADNAAPQTPQSADIQGLLQDYEKYQSAKLAGRQDSYAQMSATQMKSNWQAYLKNLMVEKPNLKPAIQKVFLEL